MELWILLPLISSLLMASVNVVDKFFVLESDDNLDYKSFCLYNFVRSFFWIKFDIFSKSYGY